MGGAPVRKTVYYELDSLHLDNLKVTAVFPLPIGKRVRRKSNAKE
jgi:hypothetical protein